MAALTKNVCLMKLIKCISNRTIYSQCLSFATCRHSPRIFKTPPTCSKFRDYSDVKAQSGGGLTDEILKQKIVDTSSNDSSSKEQKNESESEGNSSEKKKSRFSNWTGKNAWKAGLVMLGVSAVLGSVNVVILWGEPERDEDGQIIIDEFSELPKMSQYTKRAMKKIKFFEEMIKEPTSEKLLPDPLKEPYYQPPYTLVLEMTGILVHPCWDFKSGWRFQKRPGVDYFLQQVGPPLFEVVIYTQEQGFTAFPIIDGVDPQGFIMYRLFRDATRYLNGHHVKDLSCLNRDLKKVIFVDHDKKSFQLQPRNSVCLKRWTGDNEDRTLVDLATMLRMIGTSNVEDVRTVLDYYNQFDDPVSAFKINQEKLQEEQMKKMQELQDNKTKQTPLAGVSRGFFGRR